MGYLASKQENRQFVDKHLVHFVEMQNLPFRVSAYDGVRFMLGLAKRAFCFITLVTGKVALRVTIASSGQRHAYCKTKISMSKRQGSRAGRFLTIQHFGNRSSDTVSTQSTHRKNLFGMLIISVVHQSQGKGLLPTKQRALVGFEFPFDWYNSTSLIQEGSSSTC